MFAQSYCHSRPSLLLPLLAATAGLTSATPIDKTLLESAILIHHEALTGPESLNTPSRFRRALVSDTDIQNTVDSAFPASGRLSTDFASTMKGLLKGGNGQNTNAEIIDGVQTALEYLRDQKETFGLDVAQISQAAQALVQAALEASAERDPDPDPVGLATILPSVGIKTFIPAAARMWGEYFPEVTKSLSESMAKGAMTANLPVPDKDNIVRIIIEGTITATLEQIRDSTPDPSRDLGFHPGIVAVDRNGNSVDATMMLDGLQGKHQHFHPDKTRMLEYAANGLAYGVLISARNNGYPTTNIPELAENIGSGTAKAAVDFMATLDPGTDPNKDHSLFTYEVVKSIASGVSLGSTLVTGSHRPWKINQIPESVAERLAYGVASSAIESNLVNQWANDKKADIARIGEAAAFGSSMGAQFATIFDPTEENYSAWDYELYGQKSSYDRASLAEASSKGAAEGAISKAAEFVMDLELDENAASAARQEILDLARGTAMGAVLSNVAMAIYYETDLQSVIMASSKGATYGSITAENLHSIEKPRGQTEEFEVEIARAVANGASTGALFEVVGLLDAKPDIRRSDIDSITSAKSASYGSTLGAILGGDEAGQDSIAVKQAAEQGATEGSMDGVALAMGLDEANVADVNIKSERAIKNAVGIGNTEAANKAAADLATKSIQPRATDMLMLMQKYNISPGTTNPGFVFPSPTKSGEEDFLFDEKFPVASPI